MKIEKGKREEEKGKGKGNYQLVYNAHLMATSLLHPPARTVVRYDGPECQKGRNSTKFTIFDELVWCNSGRIYYLFVPFT